MENIPSIISAIGVIVAAFFSYNQYAKNKMTDLKIEQWKKREEEKTTERSHNISQIYGRLWQILHKLKADRVYIIQPHPLTNNLYLSIGLEVKRNGVSGMKEAMQNLPMCDIAAFSAELSKREFLYYKDIEGDIKDKKARSMLSCNGSSSIVIKKLEDDKYFWKGSLCCEFIREMDIDLTFARVELAEIANEIQYILPEYK